MRASGTLAAGIFGSRILGLVRDMLRAYLLGTGAAADAWVIAYRLPNLLRAFFAEGTLSAAFVPVLSRAVETRPREAVWRLVNAVLSTLLVVLAAVTFVAVLAAPLYMPLLAPGFRDLPGKLELTTWLTRATFPYLILIGLATVCMGTLNAFQHFKAPALAPGVMNLFLIGALAGLCPLLGEAPEVQVKGLAAGVIAGGIAQLLVQLPPLYRMGYRPRFLLDWKDPDVKTIRRLMLPGLVGIGVTEINALVDTLIGSLLEEGSVASLEYGLRLVQLPLGVIGVALGTAALPTLSRQAAREDWAGLRETYSFVLRMILFLMAPAMVILITLARPIVQLLFERGNFVGATSTAMTAHAIAFFAVGLLFYGAAKVTAPVFFSLHDTKTPVRCAIVALVSNIVLNLALMGPMRLGGLALATSLSAGLNLALLMRALRARLGTLRGREILSSALRIAAASAIMAFVVLATSRLLPGAAHDTFARSIAVAVPIACGVLAFGVTAFWLGSPEIRFVGTTLRSRASSRGARTSSREPEEPGERMP